MLETIERKDHLNSMFRIIRSDRSNGGLYGQKQSSLVSKK